MLDARKKDLVQGLAPGAGEVMGDPWEVSFFNVLSSLDFGGLVLGILTPGLLALRRFPVFCCWSKTFEAAARASQTALASNLLTKSLLLPGISTVVADSIGLGIRDIMQQQENIWGQATLDAMQQGYWRVVSMSLN